jgi:hypothetical protein
MDAYEGALDSYRAALAEFRTISDDYRKGKCNNDTFISARKEFNNAQIIFDIVEGLAAHPLPGKFRG